MEFNTILTTIGTFIVFFILLWCGRYVFLHKKRETIIKNFESYSAVLQYHMEKAYSMIHKDQILVYSLEATTLPDDKLNSASVEFIKLVQKLLGPTLTKEMIFLYGDYDTFIFNIAEYFSTNYDADEIRKASMDDMMQSEVEPIEGS